MPQGGARWLSEEQEKDVQEGIAIGTWHATMTNGGTMNAKDLDFFKDLLLTQRAEILNRTDAFNGGSAIESTGQGDEGDQAISEMSLSMTLRLQERQTQLLMKIDHALGKIEDGSFGLCEQCEEQLNISRLKARPVATLCIACKEEQELRVSPSLW